MTTTEFDDELEGYKRKIIEEQEQANKQEEQEEEEKKSIPTVTEEDIDFVIATITKEAAYDKPSITQTFYGMLTAFTKLGMGHKVNSRDSGSGKSYLLGKVAVFFPKKHTPLFYKVLLIKPFSISKGN